MNFRKRKILDPISGCPWAEKMVLNPAITADPGDPKHLLMLFRSTGPWPQARQPGKPLPYPIFLGFGESFNGGERWDFDLSRPAMAPRLEYDRDTFVAAAFRDGRMFDYANGCIEDPRLFHFEEELYLSVACRAFPPGPYWEHDDPLQCLPDWAAEPRFGAAVHENSTVSLLYRVNFPALAKRDYENAFALVGPLHQPDVSDDRDVVLFPRRLRIDGLDQIVCVHRPKHPWHYAIGEKLTAPSIFLAAADSFADFHRGKATLSVLATPCYQWEANRIGASFAPIELSEGEWLLPYHGKQDDTVGYTQSFMLLRENGTLNPEIAARPERRLLFADADWELGGDFNIPCLFSCSGVIRSDGSFLMGYGAADRVAGVVETDFAELVSQLRRHPF